MRRTDGFRSLRRSFATALRHPRKALTAAHVLALLTVVEIAIRYQPLPKVARVLGCPLDLGAGPQPVPERLPHDQLSATARRQLRFTDQIVDIWPFATGPCLRRALVGGHLLRAHRPSIRIGTRRGDDGVSAHAWLEIAGRPLEDISDYDTFEHAVIPIDLKVP